MSRYVEVIVCLLLGAAIIALTSGIFTPQPKFEAWDQPCVDGKKVLITRVISGFGKNHYEIYDNGNRTIIEDWLVVECE